MGGGLSPSSGDGALSQPSSCLASTKSSQHLSSMFSTDPARQSSFRTRYNEDAYPTHELQVEYNRSTMVWKNIDAIIEGRLFVGNLVAARSTRSLSDHRITHIISVCTDAIPAELPESGIRHMRIPIEDVDYADLLIHLPSACQFIHNSLRAGGVVLIHCGQGLSRGPAVAAAYLMFTRRLNATQALEAVRQCRENIWPNPGFQEQLVLFELCHYAPSPSNGIYVSWRSKLERRLRAAGMI